VPKAVLRRVLLPAAILIVLASLTGAARPSRVHAAEGAPQTVIVALDPAGPAPGSWSCLASNPSCARHDEWWREALLQSPAPAGARVRFSPLGSGFAADAELAEAVLWVWTWPDGRQLLRTAAAHGVTARFRVFAASQGRAEAAARYDARTRTVEIDPRFAGAPSWLLGDVLAHELTHAAQDSAGQRLDAGPAGCVPTELPARRNEVAYAGYLIDQLGAPPPDAAGALTSSGFELYRMLQGLLASSDLPGLVAQLCAAQTG